MSTFPNLKSVRDLDLDLPLSDVDAVTRRRRLRAAAESLWMFTLVLCHEDRDSAASLVREMATEMNVAMEPEE